MKRKLTELPGWMLLAAWASLAFAQAAPSAALAPRPAGHSPSGLLGRKGVGRATRAQNGGRAGRLPHPSGVTTGHMTTPTLRARATSQ